MSFSSIENKRNSKKETKQSDLCYSGQKIIQTAEELGKYINLTNDEKEAIEKRSKEYPLKVTEHYAKLLDKNDPEDPLRKMVVPTCKELVSYADDDNVDVHKDEARHQPCDGIIHRYTGKLLLFPTANCISYCRFCFRAGHKVNQFTINQLSPAFQYIREHKEIRDVVITGGEPMVLSTDDLDKILTTLRKIEHVEIIRITTRGLIYLPQKFDENFVNMLAKHKPLIIINSFLHPREISPETEEALARCSDAGIVLLQQGPILRGINDNALLLRQLYEKLIKNRVIAYYAIWGILAPTVRHFAITGKEARDLISALENRTSGFCLPHLITLDQGNNKTRSIG